MRCALGRGPTRLDLARASARLKELVGSRLRSGRDHPSTGSSSLVRQEMDGTKFCWFLGNRVHRRGRAGTPPASLPSLQTSTPDRPQPFYTRKKPTQNLYAIGAIPRPHPIPHADDKSDDAKTTGQSWLQKGRATLVGTRRRRHELAHHDGVRVPGYFGIYFFEAQFAVQVVGRLVVLDAR